MRRIRHRCHVDVISDREASVGDSENGRYSVGNLDVKIGQVVSNTLN